MSCETDTNKACLGDVFCAAMLRIEGNVESSDETPVPVDLTGKTMRAVIREKMGDRDTIANLSSADASPKVTFPDAAAGEYQIEVPASRMADCTPNRAYVMEVDYFTTSDPDDLEVVFWAEFTPKAKINPTTPT